MFFSFFFWIFLKCPKLNTEIFQNSFENALWKSTIYYFQSLKWLLKIVIAKQQKQTWWFLPQSFHQLNRVIGATPTTPIATFLFLWWIALLTNHQGALQKCQVRVSFFWYEFYWISSFLSSCSYCKMFCKRKGKVFFRALHLFSLFQ